MNAFYAKVAAEAEAKCTAPSKDGSDLDDWLEGFDFDEKQAQKAKIPVSKFATEASLDSLNPKGTSTMKETAPSTEISSPNANSNSRTPPSTSNSKSVSRRSLLNSLLTPEEESGSKGEFNLDNSSEVKATPYRYSVRFMEKSAEDPPDLAPLTEVKNQYLEDNEDSKNASSCPQTVPSGRRRSGAGWGDFESDFDWLTKSPSGGGGSKSYKDDKFASSKSPDNLSLDGNLNLNETITENKSAAKAVKISADRSILSLGNENTRRSLILKSSKERSPSWEPQRTSSVVSQIIDNGTDSSPKVQQLQAELEALRSLLKMTKDYHRDELRLLEQSHSDLKAHSIQLLLTVLHNHRQPHRPSSVEGTILEQRSRIELLEENSRRREKHLQEELEFSLSQCKAQITQMEQFIEASRAELASNLVAFKNDSVKTITNLRNEHAMELEALAERHTKAIESLRTADSKEARVLSEMQPTATALQALLTQLLSATNEIKQAEVEHAGATAQRLAKLDRREEVLRMAEERLCDREKEIDKMHLALTEAISKLEVQLKEQNKSLEDERWTMKQEQMRLTKLQVILEEDRRALIEQARKERIELQQLITTFFEEYRESQARLASERNFIMEEQQKLKLDQNCWRNRREEEEKKLTDLKEEVERAKEAFQIERHTLDERIHQLRLDEVKLTETQHQLDIIRNNLQNKEIALNERAVHLDRQNEELINKAAAISGNQAAVTETDAKCRRLAEEQARTQSKLQKRRQELDEREKRLVKEEEVLAQRESELDQKEKADRKLFCSRCKQAVKKISRSGCNSSFNNHPPDRDKETTVVEYRSPDFLSRGGSVARPDTLRLIADSSTRQTRSRILEQLRRELAEDKELLENEWNFLTALRHTPYA